MSRSLLALLALTLLLAAVLDAESATLVNNIVIPGDAIDLAPGPNSANKNRLGGFGSDLYYDRISNTYFGIPDRGPGGGLLSYDTRVQEFTLNVDPTTGAIGGFTLKRTIIFKDTDGTPFNGLNPQLLNGNKAVLGRSFDPEGFVVGKQGTFFVSDEYGPSVYEFDRNGKFLRAFQTPSNLVPREAPPANTLNFVDGRPTITTGRQDNRGFEGLARSPDGKKLYAIMQDPLVNEGNNPNPMTGGPDGRFSRNLRIVEFDVATGQPGRQFIYQLESLNDINSRVPGNTFGANNQGRSIGVSAIVAISDTKFLVIERDNRGLGVDALVAGAFPPVASKRAYVIDITGATDVQSISLANTNGLIGIDINTNQPVTITPVTKSLQPDIDVQAALQAAGITVPEKLEGLTIGPELADGSHLILFGTDNDFSVTQLTGANVTQNDVCTNGLQIPLDANGVPTGACPPGSPLVPSFLFAFRDTSNLLGDFVQPERVPAPGSLVLLLTAGGFLLAARRARD